MVKFNKKTIFVMLSTIFSFICFLSLCISGGGVLASKLATIPNQDTITSEQIKAKNDLTVTNYFTNKQYVIANGRIVGCVSEEDCSDSTFQTESGATNLLTSTVFTDYETIIGNNSTTLSFDDDNKLELLFLKQNYIGLSSFSINKENIASKMQATKTQNEIVIDIIDEYDIVNLTTSHDANYTLGSMALNCDSSLSYSAAGFSISQQAGGAVGLMATSTETAHIFNLTSGSAKFSGEKTYTLPSGKTGRAFNQTGGTLTIEGLTLNNFGYPSKNAHGGAVQSVSTSAGNSLIMTNVNISGSKGNWGGGVYYKYSGSDTAAKLSISGGTISNCEAHWGGGIYFDYGKAEISTSVKNCKGTSAGGAMYAYKHTSLTISGGTYSGNTSPVQGGALFIESGTNVISGGTFTNNIATEAGGALHAQGTNTVVTISGGTFSGNTGLNGSGINASCKTLNITGGTFTNTTTGYGGTLHIESGTVNMSGGTITGSQAQYGGAVYIQGGSFNLSGTASITGNTATADGGGIYAWLGPITMTGGTISNNEARSGAGIYNANTTTISGGTISGNIATTHGGGVYTGYSSKTAYLTLSGTYEITGNTASWGAGLFAAENFTLNGGKVFGNTGANAPQIYLERAKYVTVNAALTESYDVYKWGLTSIDDGDTASSYIAYSTTASYLTTAFEKITLTNLPVYDQLITTRKTNYLVCEYKVYTLTYNFGNGATLYNGSTAVEASKTYDITYTAGNSLVLYNATKNYATANNWNVSYVDTETECSWTKNTTYSLSQNISSGHYGNVTLKLTYTWDTYTVEFNNNGYSWITTKTYQIKYNSSFKATYPDTYSTEWPTATGLYRWYTTTDSVQNNGTEFKVATAITTSLKGANIDTTNHKLTVYADPYKKTIVFLDDRAGIDEGLEDSLNSSINNVRYNQTITLPTQPALVGHTFGGWWNADYTTKYGDAGSSYKNTDATNAESPLKMYAKWTANVYTLNLNANGGSCSTTSMQVTYGSAIGTLPTPTKTGFTFGGWQGKNLFDKSATPLKSGHYINGSGAYVSYGGYHVYEIVVPAGAKLTITNSGQSSAPGYAFYTLDQTYISGAGYASTKNVTVTVPSNAVYMRFSVHNTNDTESYRYDIDSFQIELGNTATSYEAYQTLTSTTVYNHASNYTATAKWTVTYTVRIAVNNSSYGSLSPTTTTISNVPYGSAITITDNKITINGTTITATASSYCKFVRWATTSTSTTAIASGTKITANTTIYAQFRGSTIKYNCYWGGSGCDTVYFLYNGVRYGGSGSFTYTGGNVVAYGLSISAAWVDNDYYSYDGIYVKSLADENSGNTYNYQKYNYDSSDVDMSYTLPTTWLKDGKSIRIGTCTESDSGETFDTSTIAPAIYSISYVLNSGTLSSKPTYGIYGKTITIANPTRTGYTFAGWKITGMDSTTHTYGSSTTTATSISSTTATSFKNLRNSVGTVTFTANWTAKTYTISYVLNGGTCTTAPTSGTWDSWVYISNPTKAGFTFSGWTITGMYSGTKYHGTSTSSYSTATSSSLSSIKSTYFKNLRNSSGTVTFTAVWTLNGTPITITLNKALGSGGSDYIYIAGGAFYSDAECTTEISRISTPTGKTIGTTRNVFDGYYESLKGTTLYVSSGGYIQNSLKTAFTADGTIYAKYVIDDSGIEAASVDYSLEQTEEKVQTSGAVWLDDKFRKLQENSETEVDFEGISFSA